MESRKITIISSTTQSRYDIMSDATTLAELKTDMRGQGIDYDGQTFMEGYSKTELKSDESLLPTNVKKRNGEVTNELVFMLTTPQKKIKSGAMDRRDCYDFMHYNPDAAAAFKSAHGKNYTNGSTAALNSFIDSWNKSKAISVTTTVTVDSTGGLAEELSKRIEKAVSCLEDLYDDDDISRDGYYQLLSILNDGGNTPVAEEKDEEDLKDLFDFV